MCACRVDTFGELTDAEQFILLAHDHPVLKTAAKFMISLVTDYSKDLLELDRLARGKARRSKKGLPEKGG